MDATDSPSPPHWWLRIFLTLASVILLYVLSIGPVDYYLGYQWGRSGGGSGGLLAGGTDEIVFSGGTLHIAPHIPAWRDHLYQPLYDTADDLDFAGLHAYTQWFWNRGFHAGTAAFSDARAARRAARQATPKP
jgi:hypothetical protein